MKVQIIVGSTRPGRVGMQLGEWVYNNVLDDPDIRYEIVDLAKHNLPLFNEPNHPKMNLYTHEYTKSWSNTIKNADGYIFLTPEYNAGYSAVLKNAIDYLYNEWLGKPVMIISYGMGGGGTASTQLKQVVERLKMRPTQTSPAIMVNRDNTDKNGHIINIDDSFNKYVPVIQEASKQLMTLLQQSVLVPTT